VSGNDQVGTMTENLSRAGRLLLTENERRLSITDARKALVVLFVLRRRSSRS
jgi:hypothetical protein